MIEITLSRKNSIVVESPVLLAAGAVGFDGSAYRHLLNLDRFGALTTTPVTYAPRQPAGGTRVVPMTAGMLLHTGLPNPGISRVIRDYEKKWKKCVLPVILHLVAETPDALERAMPIINRCPAIAGIELGLHDEVTPREMQMLLRTVKDHSQLPVLVRLPLYTALELAEIAQQAGADALVVASPPRGTERDKEAARLIGGRLYGPWLKAPVLRQVGRVVQYADIPVIASGGIHSVDDARDFLAAGARAIQLDTVVWVRPQLAEKIARELGKTGMTDTTGQPIEIEREAPEISLPPDLPEVPSDDEDDITQEASLSQKLPLEDERADEDTARYDW